MKVPVGRPLPLLPLSGTHSTKLEAAASSGCLSGVEIRLANIYVPV